MPSFATVKIGAEMAEYAQRAKDYRVCADQAREMAQGEMLAEHTDSLLAIAESYERLAKQFEKRD